MKAIGIILMLWGIIGLWGFAGDIIDKGLNTLSKDQVTLMFGALLYILSQREKA